VHVAQAALAALRNKQAIAVRVRSPITSSVSTLVTTVPTGTVMVRSSPALPYILPAHAVLAAPARNCFWWRKSTSVLRFSSATTQTCRHRHHRRHRAAERNELLTAEANATVAAVTCDDLDFGFVDEFHGKELDRKA
jgi:hypothetical protein